MEDIEESGLCINVGDFVFVSGTENAAAGQEWEEYGNLLDTTIVQVTSDQDIAIPTPPLIGYNQELVILTGMASGETIYQIRLSGGCLASRDVQIAIYVNPDRCPDRFSKKTQHRQLPEAEQNN